MKYIDVALYETVEIAPGIKIRLAEVRPYSQKVRLGIIAPRNVSIHREEIQEKINREESQKRDGETTGGAGE